MNPLFDRLSRWAGAIPRMLRRIGLMPRPSETLAGQWTEGGFAHQHRRVAYRLFVPAKGTGTQRPLVLMLHGCTQDPEDFAAGTRMNRLASERGFIVLYPTQTKEDNIAKCWNWFLPQHQRRERGEPALLAALTQSVTASQGADPARVYVAGLSAGGAMADILARTWPDLFAAVGVHSGLPAGAAGDLMSALSAMKDGVDKPAAALEGPALPTIVFHGDADDTVNPRNGQAVVEAARARAGAALRVKESAGRSAQGRAFTRRDFADARGRVLISQWVLKGAGHAWAGGSAAGSFTDPTGPDASAEMLRFFLAHRRQGLAR